MQNEEFFAATKTDLEAERVVTSLEGEELAQMEHMLAFFETSSKENQNIDEAFYKLARELKNRYTAGIGLDDYPDVMGNPKDRLKLGSGTTSIGNRFGIKCCGSL